MNSGPDNQLDILIGSTMAKPVWHIETICNKTAKNTFSAEAITEIFLGKKGHQYSI